MPPFRALTTHLQPRLLLRPTTQSTTIRTPSTLRTMSHLPQLDGLKIDETLHKADATRRTQRGDHIYVHYKGTLTDGSKFDSSYDRKAPLDFKVGSGQVIKGWDEGLLNMAEGEKRKLTIAPALGYGARGFPPVIPPNSTLIFETELVKIS